MSYGVLTGPVARTPVERPEVRRRAPSARDEQAGRTEFSLRGQPLVVRVDLAQAAWLAVDQFVSGLAERIRALERRLGEVERVNARLEQAALTTPVPYRRF